MPRSLPDEETFLEAGLIAFGILLLVGLTAWLFGRTKGAAQQAGRRAQGRPSPGSVPAERHQNISTTSTR